MSSSIKSSGALSGEKRASASLERRQSPVFLPWALFGMAWCVMIVYMAIGWVTGPDFAPVPVNGPDVPPDWMYTTARIIEVVSISCSLWVIYKFMIIPWRKAGQISIDGLLMCATMTIYVQDYWSNYFGFFSQLSPVFVTRGTWANYVPGWVSPNQGRLPEALLAWGLCYGSWFIFLPMVYGAKLMTRFRDRYPRMSGMEVYLAATAVFILIWWAIETIFLRTGMYTFGGAIQSLCLWAGHYWQHPVYEFVLWGNAIGMYAAAYYYKDDKGYMFFERGIANLKGSNTKKKSLRFFAMVGFTNAVMLFGWNLPMSVSTFWGGPMPSDMPSYLLGGICGPGTNYDCPAPGVPIATRSTLTNKTVPADQLPLTPAQQAIRNRHEFK